MAQDLATVLTALSVVLTAVVALVRALRDDELVGEGQPHPDDA